MSTVPATKVVGIGPPGANGLDGADYFAQCNSPQGPPGAPGLHGVDGLDYPLAGINGPNAPQHFNPPNGLNGAAGNNSQNGLNGVKGPPRHSYYYSFTQDGITGIITLTSHGSPSGITVVGNVISASTGIWLVIAENAPAEVDLNIEAVTDKVYYVSTTVSATIPFARRNRAGYILPLV